MAELIVALDHADAPAAVALLDQLPDSCAVKVGAVLLTRAGIGFVRGIVAAGHPVFLDAKWHDIPNTVSGAVAGAVELGVDMVTVHAAGGRAMLRAAVDAAGGRVRIVAVTVLTSHDTASYAALIGRSSVDLGDEVARLAELAMAAGVDGVVCSPDEVSRVRGVVGGGRIVVPGIRRATDAAGDQHRTATPEAAIAAGATHLVVGRPITAAVDPGAVYAEFLRASR
ncbi:MAG: orotidine-5'-phosphate decarboxylase [Gemmatimonadales bacterium]